MVEDLNMDTEHECDTNFDNHDTSSPMSVNQFNNFETVMPCILSGRKRLKATDDLAKDFGEVASSNHYMRSLISLRQIILNT